MPPPFLLGVDLGTTNCAVAVVDTRVADPRAAVFRIPQLTALGVVESRSVLPSFLYFPDPAETAAGGLALPWDPHPTAIVGVLARDRGAFAPARQVASAKSWLVHPAVDRRAAFLPWGGTAASPRVSPVDASARYLRYLRDAWNATVAFDDQTAMFERQSIVLTVPASFDEEARELTVDAAHDAQLSKLTLLEEPIAAFYAWIAEQRTPIALEHDDIALVCDVGGGTTDFSLIRVRIEAGVPAFERVAIGDHLLLGGDNLDLALATTIEHRIAEVRPAMRLAITQRSSLRRSCSAAKERILDDAAVDRVPITVVGAGRSLIGDSITIDLTRQDVEAALYEFLPVTAPEERPARDRRAGMRELGLPYETDPAITHHLAAFLTRSSAVFPSEHRGVTFSAGRRMICPDVVLFNGGFFTPPVARQRVAQALASWFSKTPRLLATGNLEAGVAIGAATYARLRAGIGRTGSIVKAGSGRAYYIALDAPFGAGGGVAAVCVLARGTDEGTEQVLDHPFGVVTNRAVSFSLYSSPTRTDRAGDLVTLDPEKDARAHAPLVTVLRYGRKSRHVELPVRLSVAFTEVGTLELWCQSLTSDHRWRLHFQVRSDAEQGAPDETVASEGESSEIVIGEPAIRAAETLIRWLFEGTSGDVTPEDLVAQVEKQLGYAKSAWPLGVIRQLADALLEVAEGRRLSAPLEARWLNLFGFCLRPGFGAGKDPWRITQARKVYAAGLCFASSIQNRVEWLVLWQRAAGGFTAAQQRELAQRVMADLGLGATKAKRPNPQVERESWRLLASLEHLDAATRVKIGDALIRRLGHDRDNASLLWSIGRLGARTPMYGPLTSVVGPSDAAHWLEVLVADKDECSERFAAIVRIGAMTGDALRDLDEPVVEAARQRLRRAGIEQDAALPLYEVVRATFEDSSRAFGEPLPNGLRLSGDAAP